MLYAASAQARNSSLRRFRTAWREDRHPLLGGHALGVGQVPAQLAVDEPVDGGGHRLGSEGVRADPAAKDAHPGLFVAGIRR